MRRRILWQSAAAMIGVGAIGVARPALAQDPTFPSRTIRILLPFAAGGGTDVTARVIAQKLGENLGVGVVVENRPGAQGTIAGQAVARAPADGYTLLYNTSSLILAPSLMREVPFDWRRDLAAVAGLASVPLMLVAHPSLPARTPQDFVALLKARPDGLSYASAGNGNTTHLAVLRLLQEVGATAVHVPYTGDGPALTDLVRGTVNFYMATANTALPFVRSGALRAIAVGSEAPLPTLPEVPPLASVVPGYTAESWQGIMAPAATPEPVIRRLNEELRRLLADPRLRDRLAEGSTRTIGSAPDAYRAFLEEESARWSNLIRSTGLRVE